LPDPIHAFEYLSIMTSNKRKLFSNFFSLSIVQGINFLIPLLVTPYVISRVGVDGIGVIAIAQTVMIYLSTITDYGFNVTATKDIALCKEDPIKSSEIFFTVLATKLLLTAALFILLLIFTFFIPVLQQHFFLYILGFTFVLGQALSVNWFFLGIQKMHFITIGSLFSRMIFIILLFVFIRKKEDVILFLFFLGIGNLVAAIFSIFAAINLQKLRFLKPSWSNIIVEINKGWQVMVTILSLNTYLFSGIFILRFFTNDLMVGYYSIAVRVFFAARQVIAVFSEAIYPQVCLLTVKGKAFTHQFFRQFYLPFLVGTIFGSILLFIFSAQIILLFIHEDPQLPVLLLRMLSFAPVIVCLNIPAYQLLLAFDRKKNYLRVFGFAIAINILANILMVNQWNAIGSVLSIIVTELFITAGLNIELYKNKLAGFVKPGFI